MIEKDNFDGNELSSPGSLFTSELEAIAAKNSQLEKPDQRVNIEFVYVEHTPEHVAKTLAALADKDVIYLEYIMPDQQSRLRLEQIINHITDPHFTGQVDDLLDGDDSDHMEAIIKGLKSSGKEVHLIDVYEDDPEYAKLNQEVESLEQRVDEALRTFADPDKIRHIVGELMPANGKEMRYRDDQVKFQLDSVLNAMQLARDTRKVGVVQGAVHTRSSHHLLNDPALDASRRFIGVEGSNAGDKAYFSYRWQMLREAGLRPESTMSDSLLDRGILEAYASSYLVDVSLSEVEQGEWIHSLSDQVVQDALEYIHEIGNQKVGLGAFGRSERKQQQNRAMIQTYFKRIFESTL